MGVLAMVLSVLSLISNNFVALQTLEPMAWNKCTKESFLDTVLKSRTLVRKDNAANCNAKNWKQNSSIIKDCGSFENLGTKEFKLNNPNLRKCCDAVQSDSEYGINWFFDSMLGSCFCERNNYDCIRVNTPTPPASILPVAEYRMIDHLPILAIQPDQIPNITKNETSAKYFKDFKIKKHADCLNEDGENATLNVFTTLGTAIKKCLEESCWGITHFFGLNHGNHSNKSFSVCESNATVFISSHSYIYYDLEKMNEALNLNSSNRTDIHKCSNDSYLPVWHWKCDGNQDCYNGTDELNCTECCLELDVEVDLTNYTGNHSEHFPRITGRFERLTHKHNGKVQYRHRKEPEIMLHFHSSWTKGTFWAITKAGYWTTKIPVEQIEFENDCPDELTEEKNSTFDAYFKINEREDKEWHNETVPVRLICMPTDGEWSEWNQWTDCSLTCDGGTAFRSKTCIYPDPEYRGKECSTDYPYEQTVKCNELPCNVDCVYGSWFPWSQCEADTKIKHDGDRYCYEGGQIRERYVTKITEAEGIDCDKDAFDYRVCELGEEPFPDLCKTSDSMEEKQLSMMVLIWSMLILVSV